MSNRPVVHPTTDPDGYEQHPAFGMASVHRAQVSPPGAVLFDSVVRHQNVVILTITHADRQRKLNRDWIYERGIVTEIEMSEAQWAALVSSTNSGGQPVTITWDGGHVPRLPFESRLEMSHQEARSAADHAFAEIKAAREAYTAKKSAENLRRLNAAIDNAGANVEYAARQLSSHAEDVVQKARADIEAMGQATAERHGLDPATIPAAITAGHDYDSDPTGGPHR